MHNYNREGKEEEERKSSSVVAVSPSCLVTTGDEMSEREEERKRERERERDRVNCVNA